MKRTPARLALGLVALLMTGCGGDSKTTKVVIPELPLNDSPANAMARFEAALEAQNKPGYAGLLSGDYRFGFSAATDPTLVDQYGDTWNAQDDSISAAHLFDGFTSSTIGVFVPGATRITLTLTAVTETGDSTHVDSLDVYRVIKVGALVASIELPDQGDGPIVYNLSSMQVFHLARGDVAVLRPGQESRADRWYLRRWDDLSQPFALRHPSTAATKSQSWGAVKNQYR